MDHLELSIFDVRGAFDVESAQAVRRHLTRVSETRVLLDLSHAEAIPDAALGALALVACEAGPRRLVIRGLSEHGRRILAYLGVDRLSLDEAADEVFQDASLHF
jgi:anti-anti-sigma regulatory factor